MNLLYFETDNLTTLTSLASLIQFDRINFFGSGNRGVYEDIIDVSFFADLNSLEAISESHFSGSLDLYTTDDYIYLANDIEVLNNKLDSYEINIKHPEEENYKKLITFLHKNTITIDKLGEDLYYFAAIYVEDKKLTLDIYIGAIYEAEMGDAIFSIYHNKFGSCKMHASYKYLYENKTNPLIVNDNLFIKENIISKYMYDLENLQKKLSEIKDTEEYKNYLLRNIPLYDYKKLKIKKFNIASIMLLEDLTDLLYTVIFFSEKNNYFGHFRNSDLFLTYQNIDILGALLDG